MNRHIIILAGGKGSRMNIDIPKVLYPLNERPILGWLLNNLAEISIPITLVIGSQGEKVQQRFGQNYNYVWQKQQLGTGHAVSCARESLQDFDADILILYGDHPLVKKETVENLFDAHQKAGSNITLMTAKVEDFNDWRAGFYQFGRILRDENQYIKGIREISDASEDEKNIKEINPSYFCFNAKWLWKNIDKLKTNNNQQEYYLTDLVEVAFNQGERINSIEINPIECLGINTQSQLEIISKLL